MNTEEDERYEDCKTGEDVHNRMMYLEAQMQRDIEEERTRYEEWAINKIKEECPGITDRFAWREAFTVLEDSGPGNKVSLSWETLAWLISAIEKTEKEALRWKRTFQYSWAEKVVPEVFVVSRDNARVVGVYDNKETAGIVSGWCDGDVDTFKLNEHLPKIEEGLSPWYVLVGKNGYILQAYIPGNQSWHLCAKENFHEWKGRFLPGKLCTASFKREQIAIYTFAKDRSHAESIAGNRWAQAIKNGEFEEE